MAEERGGYDIEFIAGNEPHDFTCSICLFVLREPMQAEQCGHRYCRSCIEDVKDVNGRIFCPEDCQLINVFKDKAKEREILNAFVKCVNAGCAVTKELRNMDEHQNICEFKLVGCPIDDCNEKVQRQLLNTHKKEKHNEDKVDQLERQLLRALQKIEEQGKLLETQTREFNKLKETVNTLKIDGAHQQVFCSSYIWKTYQFTRNFEAARDCEYHEPLLRRFYTSKGYCIKGELFLYGSGEEWGTRTTLHLSVEKGTFDDTLKWPMACIISSSILYNGNEIGRNSFDTKRISKRIRHIFNRPTNVDSEAYALPLLVSVENLRRYCNEDSLIMKIDLSHY